jgi:hypothetical protein
MKLREKIDAINKARTEYQEGRESMTVGDAGKAAAKIKEMVKEVSDTLTEGANPCPDCGNPPIGIFHDGTPKPFEVGCLVDRNHRVRESLPEDAVDRWNKADYDPPREPDTVVATIHDETGKVREQKTIKLKKE